MKILRQTIVNDRSLPSPTETHSCFPVLTQLRDNTLVLANRLGSTKESADGKVRIRSSRDDGKTWQCRGQDVSGPIRGTAAECRMGGVTECANGDLLLNVGWMDRTDPKLPMFHPETEGLLPVHLEIARSRNGLDRFDALTPIDVSPKIQACITGPALRLKDGGLLQGFETNKTYLDKRPWRHESCVTRSEDHGKTWKPPVVIAADPSGRLFFWDQRIGQLADGRIVAFFWTYDREKKAELPIHIVWSEDNGHSWSVPRSIGIEGQIAWPIPLADGRLAMTWVRRHEPPSIRLAISKDGQAWADEFTAYDHRAENIGPGDGKTATGEYLQTMQLWNFGLPGGVQLPGGNLLIAFYAPAGKSTCIRVAEVTL
ncbi:MAG: exo-alpha-sialidase [Verrucomicrobia bacterium]|nr:exo-alpha-sialidase [Verrucomicrobiota bacterium]